MSVFNTQYTSNEYLEKMEQFPVANWKMSERKSSKIAYVQAPT